jgi:hypothetical protein
MVMTVHFPSNQKINNFWSWFVQNQEQLYSLAKNNLQEAQTKIQRRIRSLNRFLIIELEWNNQILNMTISPDGIYQVFDVVKKIFEFTPHLPNWNFIAFRQPKPVPEHFQFDNLNYNLSDFFYIAKPADDNKLDLIILHPDYDPQNHYALLRVVYWLLKTLLGEYNTEMFINSVSLQKLQSPPNPQAKPLKNLPQQIIQNQPKSE